MNTDKMQKQKNISHGLRWGVIIGFVYAALLFLRYDQGENNALMFSVWTFAGYVIVLLLLLMCGIKRKKQEGGFIELKDAFQTMFMAVIGFEFLYMAFNFLYLKYINPDFFQHFKDSMETLLQKGNIPQSQIDEKLESFDAESARRMNLGSSFLSFAYAIVTSGIFALLFALLIKKKRQPFDTLPENN